MFKRLLGCSFLCILLSACATVDPEIQRLHHIQVAAPYVEAALTEPMTDLFAKALTPEASAHDHLRIGLALRLGRGNKEHIPSEHRAVLDPLSERIIQAEKTWITANEGKPEVFNWRDYIVPTPEEEAALVNATPYYSAHYWLEKVMTARTSRNLSIYQPPVRTGAAGTIITVPVSDYIVSPDTLLAGVKCTEALKADLDKRKEIIDTQIQSGVIDYLPSHLPLPEHLAACGGEQAFYRYGIMLMQATP